MNKETEQKTITVKEALDAGYKYCIQEDGESLLHIEKYILNDPYPLDLDNDTYLLVEKEPSMCYQIADTTIKEYLVDHICDQDEVADEDCELADLMDKVDFTAITDEVNRVLATKKYYRQTDIRIVHEKSKTNE
jgi:hypothetical protein